MMENPIQMDDLGVPLFLETPIYIYIYVQTIGYYNMALQKSDGFLSLKMSICPLQTPNPVLSRGAFPWWPPLTSHLREANQLIVIYIYIDIIYIYINHIYIHVSYTNIFIIYIYIIFITYIYNIYIYSFITYNMCIYLKQIFFVRVFLSLT